MNKIKQYKKYIELNGEKVYLFKSKYQSGNLRLDAKCEEDGGQYATISINITPEEYISQGIPEVKEDEIFVKTYSENSGILEQLEQLNILEKTGYWLDLGYNTIPLCRVLF